MFHPDITLYDKHSINFPSKLGHWLLIVCPITGTDRTQSVPAKCGQTHEIICSSSAYYIVPPHCPDVDTDVTAVALCSMRYGRVVYSPCAAHIRGI